MMRERHVVGELASTGQAATREHGTTTWLHNTSLVGPNHEKPPQIIPLYGTDNTDGRSAFGLAMAIPDVAAVAATEADDEDPEEPERLKYARMGGDISNSLRGAARSNCARKSSWAHHLVLDLIYDGMRWQHH
jgi:hypothetical protein